jgi:hypothetical protein
MAILLAGIQQVTIAGAEVKQITTKTEETITLVSLILGTKTQEVATTDEEFDPYAEAFGGGKTGGGETSLGFMWPKFDPATTITEYKGKNKETRNLTRQDCYLAYIQYVNQLLTALAPASMSTKISSFLTAGLKAGLFSNLEAEYTKQLETAGKTPTKQDAAKLVLENFPAYINESDENYNQVCEAVAYSFCAKVNELADSNLLRPVNVKLLRKSVESNYGVLPYVNVKLKIQEAFVQAADEPLTLAYSNYEKGLDKEGKPLITKDGKRMLDRSSAAPHAGTTLPEDQAAKQAATMSIDGAVAGLLA